MTRKHHTPTEPIANALVRNLETLKSFVRIAVERQLLDEAGVSMVTEAVSGIETFCAISLRIIAKTNPSKVRDEARTVEIQSLSRPF